MKKELYAITRRVVAISDSLNHNSVEDSLRKLLGEIQELLITLLKEKESKE